MERELGNVHYIRFQNNVVIGFIEISRLIAVEFGFMCRMLGFGKIPWLTLAHEPGEEVDFLRDGGRTGDEVGKRFIFSKEEGNQLPRGRQDSTEKWCCTGSASWSCIIAGIE